MHVTITCIAFQEGPPPEEQIFLLQGSEATIGRSPDNDFVINDPDHYASRFHARLLIEMDDVYIEDTSNNGTLINDSVELFPGQRHILADGDTLLIGECTLAVNISEHAPASPEQPVREPTESSAPQPREVTERTSSSSREAAQAEPTPEPEPVAEPESEEEPEPKLQPQRTEAPVAPPEPAMQPEPEPEAEPEIDLSSIDDAFDFLDDPADPEPEPEPEPDPEPEAARPSQAARSVNPLRPDPVESQAPPPPSKAAETLVPIVEKPKARPAPEPAARAPQATPKQAADHDNTGNYEEDSEAIDVFLEELKINAEDLDQDIVNVMGVAGIVMYTLTQGVMEMLKARTSVKKTFGMDTTKIKGVRNNSLKFSLNPEEALTRMLNQEDGFLNPLQSVEEAVHDAQAHQVAMVSGMNAAIRALLARFDPKVLEESLDSSFSLNKKSKYWDLYTEQFEQIARESEDQFNDLFAEEFRKTYEEQVRKLQSKK